MPLISPAEYNKLRAKGEEFASSLKGTKLHDLKIFVQRNTYAIDTDHKDPLRQLVVWVFNRHGEHYVVLLDLNDEHEIFGLATMLVSLFVNLQQAEAKGVPYRRPYSLWLQEMEDNSDDWIEHL